MKIETTMQFRELDGITVPEQTDVTVYLPEGIFHLIVPVDDPPYIIEQTMLNKMRGQDPETYKRLTSLLSLIGERTTNAALIFAARRRRQWKEKQAGRPPGIAYCREKEAIARIVQGADRPVMVGDIRDTLESGGISLAWQTIKKYLTQLVDEGEIGSQRVGRYFRYTKPGFDPLEDVA